MVDERQDRLNVLFRQEMAFYLTTDYLGKLIQKKREAAAITTAEESLSSSKMLNQHWREVMCEWAYHGTLKFSLCDLYVASGFFSF